MTLGPRRIDLCRSIRSRIAHARSFVDVVDASPDFQVTIATHTCSYLERFMPNV